jgi:5-methylcytosine-specific restriction endonuclease McrA
VPGHAYNDLPAHVQARIEARQAALALLGYKSYRHYLTAAHWQDVKARYRASDLPQACFCGEDVVDLHHLTYERIGAEELDDLAPLCRRCHQLVHALEARREPRDRPGARAGARAREIQGHAGGPSPR